MSPHRQRRAPIVLGVPETAASCPTTRRSRPARQPCPRAARTPATRRTFPTGPAPHGSTRASARYHGEGENEIVVILVAAFLEAILEDILDRIL